MSATAIPVAKVERLIEASPDDVYQAWVNRELLEQWFAPGAMRAEIHDLDVRVGGKFRITMHEPDGSSSHTAFGEFVELDPPRKIVMTWSWEEAEHGTTDSLLTVTMTASDAGTEVVLLHEKLSSQEIADKHAQGWRGCLENLAARITSFSN